MSWTRSSCAAPFLAVLAWAAAPAGAQPVPLPAVAGPLELELALPSGRAGFAEPLLSTGGPAHGDTAFIYYEAPGRVRFGWDDSAAGAVFSEPVPVSASASHRVLISMGSLLPAIPPGSAGAGTDSSTLSRLFFVQFDGRTVLRYQGDFQPARWPEEVALGKNLVGSAIVRPFFTGRLIAARAVAQRQAVAAAMQLDRWLAAAGDRAPRYPGAVRLRVRFSQVPAAAGDPLVVAGRTGAGDFLYAQVVDTRYLRFGFDHWAVSGQVSPPVEADLGVIHEVTVTMGCLYAPGDPAAAPWRNRFCVWLDGRLVLDAKSGSHPSAADQITVGCNLIGGSTTSDSFRGQIFGVARVAPAELGAMAGQ